MRVDRAIRKVFQCPHCGECHGEEIREIQVLRERIGELEDGFNDVALLVQSVVVKLVDLGA